MEYKIVVNDLDETIFLTYNSSVVPCRGECLHFPHFGAFRVIDVIHRVADDAPKDRDNDLMWIDIIIDREHPVLLVYTETKAVKYRVVLNSPRLPLNVRYGPGNTFDKHYRLYSGDIVNIVEVHDGWGKIREGEWVSMDYLRKVDTEV